MKHLKTYSKLFESIDCIEELSNIETDVRDILLYLSDEDIQSAIRVDKGTVIMEIHLYRESEFPDPNRKFHWKDVEETINRINNYLSSPMTHEWRVSFYINHVEIRYVNGKWSSGGYPIGWVFTEPIDKVEIYID